MYYSQNIEKELRDLLFAKAPTPEPPRETSESGCSWQRGILGIFLFCFAVFLIKRQFSPRKQSAPVMSNVHEKRQKKESSSWSVLFPRKVVSLLDRRWCSKQTLGHLRGLDPPFRNGVPRARYRSVPQSMATTELSASGELLLFPRRPAREGLKYCQRVGTPLYGDKFSRVEATTEDKSFQPKPTAEFNCLTDGALPVKIKKTPDHTISKEGLCKIPQTDVTTVYFTEQGPMRSKFSRSRPTLKRKHNAPAHKNVTPPMVLPQQKPAIVGSPDSVERESSCSFVLMKYLKSLEEAGLLTQSDDLRAPLHVASNDLLLVDAAAPDKDRRSSHCSKCDLKDSSHPPSLDTASFQVENKNRFRHEARWHKGAAPLKYSIGRSHFLEVKVSPMTAMGGKSVKSICFTNSEQWQKEVGKRSSPMTKRAGKEFSRHRAFKKSSTDEPVAHRNQVKSRTAKETKRFTGPTTFIAKDRVSQNSLARKATFLPASRSLPKQRRDALFKTKSLHSSTHESIHMVESLPSVIEQQLTTTSMILGADQTLSLGTQAKTDAKAVGALQKDTSSTNLKSQCSKRPLSPRAKSVQKRKETQAITGLPTSKPVLTKICMPRKSDFMKTESPSHTDTDKPVSTRRNKGHSSSPKQTYISPQLKRANILASKPRSSSESPLSYEKFILESKNPLGNTQLLCKSGITTTYEKLCSEKPLGSGSVRSRKSRHRSQMFPTLTAFLNHIESEDQKRRDILTHKKVSEEQERLKNDPPSHTLNSFGDYGVSHRSHIKENVGCSQTEEESSRILTRTLESTHTSQASKGNKVREKTLHFGVTNLHYYDDSSGSDALTRISEVSTEGRHVFRQINNKTEEFATLRRPSYRYHSQFKSTFQKNKPAGKPEQRPSKMLKTTSNKLAKFSVRNWKKNALKNMKKGLDKKVGRNRSTYVSKLECQNQELPGKVLKSSDNEFEDNAPFRTKLYPSRKLAGTLQPERDAGAIGSSPEGDQKHEPDTTDTIGPAKQAGSPAGFPRESATHIVDKHSSTSLCTTFPQDPSQYSKPFPQSTHLQENTALRSGLYMDKEGTEVQTICSSKTNQFPVRSRKSPIVIVRKEASDLAGVSNCDQDAKTRTCQESSRSSAIFQYLEGLDSIPLKQLSSECQRSEQKKPIHLTAAQQKLEKDTSTFDHGVDRAMNRNARSGMPEPPAGDLSSYESPVSLYTDCKTASNDLQRLLEETKTASRMMQAKTPGPCKRRASQKTSDISLHSKPAGDSGKSVQDRCRSSSPVNSKVTMCYPKYLVHTVEQATNITMRKVDAMKKQNRGNGPQEQPVPGKELLGRENTSYTSKHRSKDSRGGLKVTWRGTVAFRKRLQCLIQKNHDFQKKLATYAVFRNAVPGTRKRDGRPQTDNIPSSGMMFPNTISRTRLPRKGLNEHHKILRERTTLTKFENDLIRGSKTEKLLPRTAANKKPAHASAYAKSLKEKHDAVRKKGDSHKLKTFLGLTRTKQKQDINVSPKSATLVKARRNLGPLQMEVQPGKMLAVASQLGDTKKGPQLQSNLPFVNYRPAAVDFQDSMLAKFPSSDTAKTASAPNYNLALEPTAKHCFDTANLSDSSLFGIKKRRKNESEKVNPDFVSPGCAVSFKSDPRSMDFAKGTPAELIYNTYAVPSNRKMDSLPAAAQDQTKGEYDEVGEVPDLRSRTGQQRLKGLANETASRLRADLRVVRVKSSLQHLLNKMKSRNTPVSPVQDFEDWPLKIANDDIKPTRAVGATNYEVMVSKEDISLIPTAPQRSTKYQFGETWRKSKDLPIQPCDRRPPMSTPSMNNFESNAVQFTFDSVNGEPTRDELSTGLKDFTKQMNDTTVKSPTCARQTLALVPSYKPRSPGSYCEDSIFQAGMGKDLHLETKRMETHLSCPQVHLASNMTQSTCNQKPLDNDRIAKDAPHTIIKYGSPKLKSEPIENNYDLQANVVLKRSALLGPTGNIKASTKRPNGKKVTSYMNLIVEDSVSRARKDAQAQYIGRGSQMLSQVNSSSLLSLAKPLLADHAEKRTLDLTVNDKSPGNADEHPAAVEQERHTKNFITQLSPVKSPPLTNLATTRSPSVTKTEGPFAKRSPSLTNVTKSQLNIHFEGHLCDVPSLHSTPLLKDSTEQKGSTTYGDQNKIITVPIDGQAAERQNQRDVIKKPSVNWQSSRVKNLRKQPFTLSVCAEEELDVPDTGTEGVLVMLPDTEGDIHRCLSETRNVSPTVALPPRQNKGNSPSAATDFNCDSAEGGTISSIPKESDRKEKEAKTTPTPHSQSLSRPNIVKTPETSCLSVCGEPNKSSSNEQQKVSSRLKSPPFTAVEHVAESPNTGEFPPPLSIQPVDQTPLSDHNDASNQVNVSESVSDSSQQPQPDKITILRGISQSVTKTSEESRKFDTQKTTSPKEFCDAKLSGYLQHTSARREGAFASKKSLLLKSASPHNSKLNVFTDDEKDAREAETNHGAIVPTREKGVDINLKGTNPDMTGMSTVPTIQDPIHLEEAVLVAREGSSDAFSTLDKSSRKEDAETRDEPAGRNTQNESSTDYNFASIDESLFFQPVFSSKTNNDLFMTVVYTDSKSCHKESEQLNPVITGNTKSYAPRAETEASSDTSSIFITNSKTVANHIPVRKVFRGSTPGKRHEKVGPKQTLTLESRKCIKGSEPETADVRIGATSDAEVSTPSENTETHNTTKSDMLELRSIRQSELAEKCKSTKTVYSSSEVDKRYSKHEPGARMSTKNRYRKKPQTLLTPEKSKPTSDTRTPLCPDRVLRELKSKLAFQKLELENPRMSLRRHTFLKRATKTEKAKGVRLIKSRDTEKMGQRSSAEKDKVKAEKPVADQDKNAKDSHCDSKRLKLDGKEKVAALTASAQLPRAPSGVRETKGTFIKEDQSRKDQKANSDSRSFDDLETILNTELSESRQKHPTKRLFVQSHLVQRKRAKRSQKPASPLSNQLELHYQYLRENDGSSKISSSNTSQYSAQSNNDTTVSTPFFSSRQQRQPLSSGRFTKLEDFLQKAEHKNKPNNLPRVSVMYSKTSSLTSVTRSSEEDEKLQTLLESMQELKLARKKDDSKLMQTEKSHPSKEPAVTSFTNQESMESKVGKKKLSKLHGHKQTTLANEGVKVSNDKSKPGKDESADPTAKSNSATTRTGLAQNVSSQLTGLENTNINQTLLNEAKDGGRRLAPVSTSVDEPSPPGARAQKMKESQSLQLTQPSDEDIFKDISLDSSLKISEMALTDSPEDKKAQEKEEEEEDGKRQAGVPTDELLLEAKEDVVSNSSSSIVLSWVGSDVLEAEELCLNSFQDSEAKEDAQVDVYGVYGRKSSTMLYVRAHDVHPLIASLTDVSLDREESAHQLKPSTGFSKVWEDDKTNHRAEMDTLNQVGAYADQKVASSDSLDNCLKESLCTATIYQETQGTRTKQETSSKASGDINFNKKLDSRYVLNPSFSRQQPHLQTLNLSFSSYSEEGVKCDCKSENYSEHDVLSNICLEDGHQFHGASDDCVLEQQSYFDAILRDPKWNSAQYGHDAANCHCNRLSNYVESAWSYENVRFKSPSGSIITGQEKPIRCCNQLRTHSSTQQRISDWSHPHCNGCSNMDSGREGEANIHPQSCRAGDLQIGRPFFQKNMVLQENPPQGHVLGDLSLQGIMFFAEQNVSFNEHFMKKHVENSGSCQRKLSKDHRSKDSPLNLAGSRCTSNTTVRYSPSSSLPHEGMLKTRGTVSLEEHIQASMSAPFRRGYSLAHHGKAASDTDYHDTRPHFTLEQHLSSRYDNYRSRSDRADTCSQPDNKTGNDSSSSQASLNWYKPHSLPSSASGSNSRSIAAQPEETGSIRTPLIEVGPKAHFGQTMLATQSDPKNDRSTTGASAAEHPILNDVWHPTHAQTLQDSSPGNQLNKPPASLTSTSQPSTRQAIGQRLALFQCDEPYKAVNLRQNQDRDSDKNGNVQGFSAAGPDDKSTFPPSSELRTLPYATASFRCPEILSHPRERTILIPSSSRRFSEGRDLPAQTTADCALLNSLVPRPTLREYGARSSTTEGHDLRSRLALPLAITSGRAKNSQGNQTTARLKSTVRVSKMVELFEKKKGE